MCTDPGLSYRNYLGTCILYGRLWRRQLTVTQFEGFKLVTNLKETKEAKCNVWEPMENTAHGYVVSRGSSWLLT